MAASTKQFTLTSSAYQDLSEGAANCAFRVPFHRQRSNAIRVVLGQSLPAVNSTTYDTIDTNNFSVGPNESPQEFPLSFNNLAPTDRVYARADSSNVSFTVYRI
jgi:hypothetical protein